MEEEIKYNGEELKRRLDAVDRDVCLLDRHEQIFGVVDANYCSEFHDFVYENTYLRYVNPF